MPKIKLETTHQKVFELLKKMILTGELQKGQKINELQLCELLGVSRTPIREALRNLHTTGLIDLVPHRGAFVSEFSIEEIKDMFEVMGMLEGMCARLATQQMSNSDFAKINALHEELEKHYLANDHNQYMDTNHKYHTFIQQLAANKALNEAVNVIRQKILLVRHKLMFIEKRFDQSIQEHRNLLEAFRKKDDKKAEKLMHKHLIKQGKALMRQYSKDN